MRRIVVGFCKLAIALSLVALIAPLFLSSKESVVFRQYELSRLIERKPSVLGWIQEYVRQFQGVYAPAHIPSIDVQNIDSVASIVVRALPFFTVVYPTEGYQYFRFSDSKGEISGNIRFTWLDNGIVGIGAFRVGDPMHGIAKTYYAGKDFWHFKITKRLEVVCIIGTCRIVLLPSTILEETAPKEAPLLNNEDYVTWVRDESGVAFHLVFNRVPPSFYYILDEENSRFDTLQDTGEGLRYGAISQFSYFKDPEIERFILVGVQKDSIAGNNYYDGPFDQVPADVPIRDKVYEAYPYLQLGGVDEFGHQCLNHSSRVAISPYATYETMAHMTNRLADCKSRVNQLVELRHCLTFDEKQYFHRESDAFTTEGKLKKGTARSCRAVAEILSQEGPPRFPTNFP